MQGLSPYADSLVAALRAGGEIDVDPVDYRAAYPRWLHPAAGGALAGASGVHWGDPRTWKAVAKARGDVLHLQHWLPALATYLSPLARMVRAEGKRVVVTVHNPRPHESLLGVGFAERRLLSAADVLVVHDERGRDALRTRLGGNADIRVIPHGVVVANALPTERPGDRQALDLPKDRRLVTTFGNLRGYKGVPALLAAWARIVAEHPDTDLVIAGRLWSGRASPVGRMVAKLLGTDREASLLADALADPRLAGRVHLREGFLPEPTVDGLLRASALAVFAYERFSSQSGAATRAGGRGVPLLVSDVGGLPELALGPDWVVPAGDVMALAGALTARLRDPALIDARGRQLAVLSPFAWPRVAQAHAALYRELAAGRLSG